MRKLLAKAFLALVLLGAGRAGADSQVVQFHTAEAAPDLNCPTTPQAPASGPPPAYPAPPGRAELGQLAQTVVREQPRLNVHGLDQLADREVISGRPLRVGIWGDSHIAAGPLAATLKARIQARGYRSGSSFLPPTMGRTNVRLGASLKAYCLGDGWTSVLAFTSGPGVQAGPALIKRVAEAGEQSWLSLDFRTDERRSGLKGVALVYCAPRGGLLGLSINGSTEQVIRLTQSQAPTLLRVINDAGVSTLKLRVLGGRLEIHGFELEDRTQNAVVLDVFGLPSSTVSGWANADTAFMKATLDGRSYDAVVLEYGTNEAAAPSFNPESYRRTLRAALSNLRAVFPGAGCVLVGPPDRGVLRRYASEPLDFLSATMAPAAVSAVQRETAAEFGCAFWDWQGLMGGRGGSYGWAFAEPPLMARDLTHMSAAGYRLTAEALARSLGF